MELRLKGKVALITGSSKGIGRGIANILAQEGCHITLCARQKETLDSASDEIRNMGTKVLPVQCDITKPGESDRLVASTIAHFKRIDILVNNVGGNRRKNFEQTSDEDWEDIINLNLSSHIRVTRGVIPLMKKQGSGSIIFISSIFGRESGGPTLSIYNTTKSALISLAKIMSVELAVHGIRVNSVAPGSILFSGGSWDKRSKQDPKGIAEFIKLNLPFGRFGSVEEVANVVAFLASEKSSWVSGTCINVDGCQSRSLI
jgi:3-oxoacyl-[acyl-carrier protein] reductase